MATEKQLRAAMRKLSNAYDELQAILKKAVPDPYTQLKKYNRHILSIADAEKKVDEARIELQELENEQTK